MLHYKLLCDEDQVLSHVRSSSLWIVLLFDADLSKFWYNHGTHGPPPDLTRHAWVKDLSGLGR